MLLLLTIALTACAEKDLPENAIYAVLNHPEIKRPSDLQSFTIDGVALSYSLRTIGAGEEQSLRLEVLDLRFGQPGEHAPYRVICSSARISVSFEDNWVRPRYYNPRSGLEGCDEEAMLDGKSKGVSIQFYGSNKSGDKLLDRFTVATPVVVLGPKPPLVTNDAYGNRVVGSRVPPTGKQYYIDFARPGYDPFPGGFH